MKQFLTILAAIAEILTRLFRAKEQQQHEKQRQEIKDDPAGWLDIHFNDTDSGVQPNKPMPGNADKAEQTNTKKHPKKQ